MSLQETITQTAERVLLQIEVPELTRRQIKSEAARAGLKMGEFLAVVMEKWTREESAKPEDSPQ